MPDLKISALGSGAPALVGDEIPIANLARSAVTNYTLSPSDIFPVFNVQAYGALGDYDGFSGADDTAAIQAAINAAGAIPGARVFFPYTGNSYRHTGLTISTPYMNLMGAKGTRLINTGAGAAITVTGNFLTIEGLNIHGNGGAFGAGASGTYGIEFNAAVHWTLRSVELRYHGSHAIYCHGGVWDCFICECDILANGGDGINSVSPGSAANQQNGNNMSIINSVIYLNAGNGLAWKASSLNVNGSVFEGNLGAGILIDTTGSTASAFGFNIAGNYFELNQQGQISLVGITSYIIFGGCITGNFIYSSYVGGATALIVGSGPAGTIEAVQIVANSYITGGSVTAWIDLGNAAGKRCMIEAPYYTTTTYVNLGIAQLRIDEKHLAVSGHFWQAGFTWTTTGKSDNNYSAGVTSGLFLLPLKEGDVLTKIEVYIETDTPNNYTVTMYVQDADPTTGGTLTTWNSLPFTKVGGGNNLFTYTIASSGTYRVAAKKKVYFKMDVSGMTGGASMVVNDPVISFV